MERTATGRFVDVIQKKRRGESLEDSEIRAMIKD